MDNPTTKTQVRDFIITFIMLVLMSGWLGLVLGLVLYTSSPYFNG